MKNVSVNRYMNVRLEDHNRTTVGSFFITMENIVLAVILPLSGMLLDRVGISMTYILVTISLLTTGIPLVVYMNSNLNSER